MQSAAAPDLLELNRYPVLASLCWFRHDAAIPQEEAYSIYVENWPYVDQTAMPEEERERIVAMNFRYGNLLRIYTPAPPAH